MTPYWGSVFFAFFAQGATMIQENVVYYVKSINQVGNGRGGGLVSETVPWELPVGRKTGKDRKKIL